VWPGHCRRHRLEHGRKGARLLVYQLEMGILDEVGLDESRTDGGYPDTIPVHLGPQTFTEPNQGGFGGGIEGPACLPLALIISATRSSSSLRLAGSTTSQPSSAKASTQALPKSSARTGDEHNAATQVLHWLHPPFPSR